MKRSFPMLIVLISVLFISSCRANTTPSDLPSTSDADRSEIQPQPSSTPLPASPTPQPIPSPTNTPNPFPNPVLKITGDEEVVFDWSNDRCENSNIPDLPARAIRNAEEQVILFLSSDNNYSMVGPDLNNLTVACKRVFNSSRNADPSQFSDYEWIASPYTEDGVIVYALVHNEYWGHTHPGYCPQQEYFPCWDNSITLAVSVDGGQNFEHAFPPPDHLVARLPYQYKAGAGPEGTRNPSNIIKGNDGYYYSFFNVSMFETQKQWVCLMRSDDLGDPKSWRFWNGKNFGGRFIDPYTEDISKPETYTCAPFEMDNIGASLNESITYNTYLERYVLVGISADTIGGREIWGYYYSFSDDLIHWTRRKLLVEMVLPWTAESNTDVMYLYPTLIDQASESLNFETTGKTAYLYYTRHNFGQGSLDRDLIRVPVEFFPSP